VVGPGYRRSNGFYRACSPRAILLLEGVPGLSSLLVEHGPPSHYSAWLWTRCSSPSTSSPQTCWGSEDSRSIHPGRARISDPRDHFDQLCLLADEINRAAPMCKGCPARSHADATSHGLGNIPFTFAPRLSWSWRHAKPRSISRHVRVARKAQLDRSALPSSGKKKQKSTVRMRKTLPTALDSCLPGRKGA